MVGKQGNTSMLAHKSQQTQMTVVVTTTLRAPPLLQDETAKEVHAGLPAHGLEQLHLQHERLVPALQEVKVLLDSGLDASDRLDLGAEQSCQRSPGGIC